MTGPEHYREAEQLTGQALDADLPTELRQVYMAAAQVHATLANAAAAALAADEALPDAWYEVLDA
jgi:hypothetical protein